VFVVFVVVLFLGMVFGVLMVWIILFVVFVVLGVGSGLSFIRLVVWVGMLGVSSLRVRFSLIVWLLI
jgi:hypothetical protein